MELEEIVVVISLIRSLNPSWEISSHVHRWMMRKVARFGAFCPIIPANSETNIDDLAYEYGRIRAKVFKRNRALLMIISFFGSSVTTLVTFYA
jgi:hypothetical protein